MASKIPLTIEPKSIDCFEVQQTDKEGRIISIGYEYTITIEIYFEVETILFIRKYRRVTLISKGRDLFEACQNIFDGKFELKLHAPEIEPVNINDAELDYNSFILNLDYWNDENAEIFRQMFTPENWHIQKQFKNNL